MKAYLTKGCVFIGSDESIIFSGNCSLICMMEFPRYDISEFLVSCERIYVEGSVIESAYNTIEVQMGTLSNGLEPEDVGGYSHFEVGVFMEENEDPICEVKDRNFKLEHLSMELQKRIHDKAEEMYQDWLKVKQD